MTTIATSTIQAARPARLSTGELLCWAAAFFVTSSAAYVLRAWREGVAAAGLVFNAVEAIAWGCALLLIVRDRAATRATAGRLAAIAALMAVAAVLPGRTAALMLIPLGAFVLAQRGWSKNERRAGAVLLAIGMQRLIGKLVPMLIGGPILRLDTAVAGVAMRWLVPGTQWEGTALRPPGEVGITVGMPCSSFANLSFVVLCFTSLYALDGGRPTWRAVGALLAICALVVVVNTARLILTARSLPSFVYWHDGQGAQFFALGLTVLTVASCSMLSRWAAAR